MFFFEKKNQKTFAQGARPVQPARRIRQKFFAAFLQKSSAFLLSRIRSPGA